MIDRMEERRRLRRTWLRGSLVAAAAATVGALLAGSLVASRYEAQLTGLEREAVLAREQVRQEPALVELLRDPATAVAPLRGSAGQGRVVWRDGVGGFVLTSGLPRAPAAHVYVVWLLGGGRPMPGGVLVLDAHGNALNRLPPAPGSIDEFRVTLEEAPMSAPQGPTVLSSR